MLKRLPTVPTVAEARRTLARLQDSRVKFRKLAEQAGTLDSPAVVQMLGRLDRATTAIRSFIATRN